MSFDRTLHVSRAAIQNNITTLRARLPEGCRMMAMVKANGYGTDPVLLSRLAGESGIDILGVAHLEEAIALREAGIEQAILVLHAWPEEASLLEKYDLEVGVSDPTMLKALKSVEVGVHLQINTGINRFGCRPQEAMAMAEEIATARNLRFRGIMTHFAAADIPEEDSFTLGQVAQFDAVIQNLKERGIRAEYTHAANSAAVVRFDLSQYNLARPGLMVLGTHPSPATEETCPLEPALRLTSRNIQIHACREGETVSYGRRYKVAQEEEEIAVIPLGYGDGIQWRGSGKGYCLVRGKRASLVGSICMDYLMLNVTGIGAAMGDEVTLFGGDEGALSAEAFAYATGTMPHELITSLGPRITRKFF